MRFHRLVVFRATGKMNRCRVRPESQIYYYLGLISSLASMSRLRPALYFTFTLAITSIIYCLVFYKPNGLVQTSFTPYKSSSTTKSPVVYLDEIMLEANKRFLDHFRKNVNQPHEVVSLVPELAQKGYPNSFQNEVSKSSLHSKMLNISNNFYKSNIKTNLALRQLQEFISIQSDDDTTNENRIEHYLRGLGFDIRRHISKKNPATKSENQSRTNVVPVIDSSLLNQSNQTSNISRFQLLTAAHLTGINIVTAISSSQLNLGIGFIKSLQLFQNTSYLSLRLIIYDLGLEQEQLVEVWFVLFDD